MNDALVYLLASVLCSSIWSILAIYTILISLVKKGVLCENRPGRDNGGGRENKGGDSAGNNTAVHSYVASEVGLVM